MRSLQSRSGQDGHVGGCALICLIDQLAPGTNSAKVDSIDLLRFNTCWKEFRWATLRLVMLDRKT
jgi:hypothetical protein